MTLAGHDMPLPVKDELSTEAPSGRYIGPCNEAVDWNALAMMVCTASMAEILSRPLELNASSLIFVTPPMLIDVKALHSRKVL